MESFLPSEIARLVLGYLEDHKCDEAYETFLRTSSHLEECLKMRDEGRKFRTQVMGLNLLNILYEYSAIFSLVQERLKKVDPETASSLKNSGSLLDKITFLLNATSSGQTMLFSITLPPGKSPSTVAHVRKRLRTVSGSDKKRDYVRKNSRVHIEEFSPIVEMGENIAKSSTFETTSLSSLPGNANMSLDRTELLEGTDIVRTPKRKTLPLNSSRRSRSNSEIPDEQEENLDITALTKALLDNHELHEKIAENINKVIHTPELVAGTNISQIQDFCSAQNHALSESNNFPNNFTFELDDAIKKIVEETESDPVFENFLQDVVCPADETSDDGEDRGISDTSTPCQSTPETVKKLSLKHRLRSSKKRLESPITSSSEINTPTKIDHQNAAAIESIISIQSKPIEPEPSTSGLQGKPSKESEPNKEIISELGLTQTSNTQPLTVQTSSAENMIMQEHRNENRNLLIAQPPAPIIISEPINFQQPIQDNRLVIVSSKMTNSGSQILTVQPAHLQTSVFAEDILTMPTVIINDEQNPGNSYVVPQKIFPTVGSTTAVNQLSRPPPPPPKVHKNPLILPHPIINTNVTTIPAETITYTFNVQTQPNFATSTENTISKLVQTIDSSNPKPTSKQVEETVAGSLPMIPMSSGKKENKTEEQKPETPDRSDKKVQLSSSTPRTVRSHIRALDFSTPPKENLPRKSLTSPKVIRGGKVTKCSRQSRLFTSPLNLPIATRSPHAKLQGDWDGSELIFVSNKSPRKSRSSESLENVEEVEDEEKLVKRRRVISLNHVSDKPLVIDESKDSVPVRIETKKEIPPKSKTKKTGSWDQDLRVNIEPVPVLSKKKKTPIKRKKRTNVPEEKVEAEDVKEIVNKTEEEGLTIEAQLAKVGNIGLSKENVESQNKKDTKETKENENKPAKVIRRRRQIKNKNAPNLENLKIEIPKIKLEEVTSLEEAVEDNSQENKESADAMRNMKPRVNKKCNVNNSTKKSVTNQEDKQKSKMETNTEEVKTVTVLSPSKMNANKRIFVEQEKPEIKDSQTATKPSNEPSTSSGIKSDGHSLITPDLLKPSCSNAVTAKRNITPMLETPLKYDSLTCPITPRLLTPFGTDASFSTLIKQNCGSVDLCSIMTPNFPMTPSFPLTPHLGTGDTHSSYASRPTDYSNSSSYYQPSDSEQNQKIEKVLIEEAMKIEASKLTKQIWTSTPDKENNLLPNKELSIPPNDTMPNSAGEIKSNETLESTKMGVDCSQCESDSDTTTSSSSYCVDEIKENLHTKKESNATVIHITPGQLRRGGKHMATLKQLVKPDDINSDSEKSESPINLIKVVVPKKKNAPKKIKKNINQMEEKTNKPKEKSNKRPDVNSNKLEVKSNRKPDENSNKLEEKYNKIEEKTNKHEESVSKVKDQTKKTVDDVKGRKFNSNVSKIQCPILKELEIKRQRIIAELNKDSTKPKLKPGRKPRLIKKIEVSTRVTRSKSFPRTKENKKKNDNKNLEVIKEKHSQPTKQKLISFKRNASIEDVAVRLRKDKDNTDVLEKDKIIDSTKQTEISKLEDKNMCTLLFSPNSSIESYNSNDVKEKGMTPGTTEDEEIPRLHLSSDEEMDETLNINISKDDDNPDIVKELKERGIHLIPIKYSDKKTDESLKDEDNPNIINTENLQLNVAEVDIFEQSFDIEDSIPQNKIEKRIEIKSDVYLDESKKIDVSKILSQSVVIDTILGKDDKNTRKIKDKIESRKEESENVATKEQEIKELKATMEVTEDPEKMVKEPETSKEVTMEPEKTIEVTKEIEKSKEIPKEINKKNEMSKEIDIPTQKETKLVNSQTDVADTVTSDYGDEYDEELFHVKIITENSPEYIQIVHDEFAVITKTIADYNFAVLKKQISAKVFLEELNIEQDRVLSVTPFIELTTFPAKIPKIILKPLDILYNEICDDSSVDTVIEEPTKTISKIDKSNKNQVKSQNSSQKTTDKRVKTNNETDKKEKQRNKSSQQKFDTTKSESNTDSPKVATKKTISLEQYKNNQTKKTKELEEKIINKMKDDDDKNMELNSEEDSLFTFAITGNEKTPKKETCALDSISKKRKAEADSTKPTSEKRIKPNDKQDMIKTVKSLDVDYFLSMLHGPSNRPS